MSYTVGNIVVQLWTVLDGSNNPLTGQTRPTGPGDGTGTNIQLWLHRQSGSTMVLASESITWTEIGATGHYILSFTPTVQGLYVLQLEEINASSLQRFYRFPDITVVSAGAVFMPAYANAFCAETDIERWLQFDITTTTNPSDAEAPAFAESRAAQLMSLCAGLGFPVTPATVTVGSRLQTLLRDANAIGAALDYTAAQILGVAPSKTDRFDYFLTLWENYFGRIIGGKEIPGLIETEIAANLVSLSTDHLLSGDTLPAPSVQATDVGIQVGMRDVF